MKFLNKLLGSEASSIVESVSNVVDEFTLSKEEKQEFKLKMQEKLLEFDRLAAESYQQEVSARADIIKAEMAQGDNFTKRARPAIIYVGLLFIFIVNVAIPIVGFFTQNVEDLTKIQLPEEFWWAWGTVVGVYGAGRSIEKFGYANKITQMATGSAMSDTRKGKQNSFDNAQNSVG